jgi:hypothetical protein
LRFAGQAGSKGSDVIKPIWALAGVALLGAAGVTGAIIVASSGGEEEVLQQVETATTTASAIATRTQSASPSATASPEPTPSGETPVPIPADWQTYNDPEGRFSIRVPRDWLPEDGFTAERPAWAKITLLDNKEPFDSAKNDWVELEIGLIPDQGGETLEDKAPIEGFHPRLTIDHKIVSGRETVRQSRGFDVSSPTMVAYVFRRDALFITVNLHLAGPETSEHINTFDELIVKSLVIPTQ